MNAPLVAQAFALLQRGDAAGAEDILTKLSDDASALHLLGVMRVRQQRLPEAAEFLARSVALQPGEAQARLNLGKVLATLDRHAEAIDELRQALPLPEARLALARSLHATGHLEEAIAAYRAFLTTQPQHAATALALADALLAARRPEEAETVLLETLAAPADARKTAYLKAALVRVTQAAKPAVALAYIDQALALDPARTEFSHSRPALLEKLHRYDDAKQAYRQLLELEPVNAELHRGYNSLLYRLGEDAEFLTSYDAVPRMQELALDKASFLLSAGRHAQAGQCFKAVGDRYGDSKQTLLGMGVALLKDSDAAAAVAIFQDAAARFPGQPDIHCNLASALFQLGDPRKAQEEITRVLQAEPFNQLALAMQGTCWRLLNDERDEALSGYEDFIQVIDLEPPDGFADMASFHAALMPMLDAMHPFTREYLGQSLRGGTQTPENILEQGHALVEKLRARIDEAVAGYISRQRKDDAHPYLARMREEFSFSGSWSSRLRDTGFHINHLHPGGWISSCYYVDLPPAVDDPAQQQGWIKFGQPSFDVGLEPRRVLQPVAGRLVLFPSYMWHGTIPFRDTHPRTTIAFDVLPR